jgi:hypothetical protein
MAPVTTHPDENSTYDQDARWTGPRLITIGAIALAIALAIIYTAATVIGE